MSIDRFSRVTIERVGSYVYCLIDPRDNRPFYVGKGKGNRVFAHLAEARQGKPGHKTARIRELFDSRLEPKLDVLRHGLDSETAIHVEAAAMHVIDMMEGTGTLTNAVQGHGVRLGRTTAEELEARYNRQPASIDVPSVLIRIAQEYHADLTSEQLYERTRRYWKLSLKSASRARYAFAVADGIIRQVYDIQHWMRAGDDPEPRDTSRIRELHPDWESRKAFVGSVAEEMSGYVGKTVDLVFPQGARFPVRYMNI